MSSKQLNFSFFCLFKTGKGKPIDTGYPGVKELYRYASEFLKYDLLELSINGPKDKLKDPIYRYPAIYVASLAAVEK